MVHFMVNMDNELFIATLLLELQQNVADNEGTIDYERFEADALALLNYAQLKKQNEDRSKMICPYSLLPCKFSV